MRRMLDNSSLVHQERVSLLRTPLPLCAFCLRYLRVFTVFIIRSTVFTITTLCLIFPSVSFNPFLPVNIINMYKCDQCPSIFNMKRNLVRHLKTHSGVRFSCNVCPSSFSYSHSLVRHTNKFHRMYL